jgi:flagella basal body P-ring formation protein FlgA
MKVQAYIIALLYIVAPWYLHGSTFSASVRLMDSVVIEAPIVTLGEVAYIECDDEAMRRDLSEIYLDRAPALGRYGIISSFKVKSRLQREGFSDVKVFGMQACVETAKKELSRKDVEKHIMDWAYDNLLKEGVEVDVDIVSLQSHWEIPEGDDIEISIDTSSRKKDLRGQVYLSIRAMSEGAIFASTSARIDVSTYRVMPVLMQPVLRGEQITNDHIEERRVDVTDVRGMEALDKAQIVGLVAKRNLPVDSLLSVRDFEMPILIERGSMNRIVINNGGVNMKVSGARALQSGRKGDIIIFSNPLNDKETLHARVMKRGVAVINLK